MSGAEAFEPEMKRSPVKVSHVASKLASAWEWTVKYGRAPFSSISYGKGILRGGHSARTIGPGLEFSLVHQLPFRKAVCILDARKEIRNHTAKNLEAIRLLRSRQGDLERKQEPGNKHIVHDMLQGVSDVQVSHAMCPGIRRIGPSGVV